MMHYIYAMPLLLAVPAGAIGQSIPTNGSDISSFKYLMLGMKDQRDRLSTGSYHAHGLILDMDETYGKLQGDIELFGIVDYANGRQRFDRREPVRMKLDKKSLQNAKGPSETWKQEMVSSKYIQTRKETTYYLEGSKSIVIRGPDSTDKIEGEPLDPRALAFLYWVDLKKGITFPEIFDAWVNQKPLSVAKITDAVYCITWEFPDTQRQLWINEASGFSPIKCEVRRKVVAKGKNESNWSEVKLVIELSWTQLDSVWVPKTYRIQDDFTSNSKSLSLSFDWESVNQSVSEEELTIAGFRLKTKTMVVDTKLGQPILTDILNDTVRQPEMISSNPPKNRRPYFLLITGVGLSMLLIFLLSKYVRHQRVLRTHIPVEKVQEKSREH